MADYQTGQDPHNRADTLCYQGGAKSFFLLQFLFSFLLVATAGFSANQSAANNELTISASLDRNKALVGEPVTLKLLLKWRPQVLVPSVLVDEENLGAFRIVSKKSSENQAVNGFQQREVTVILSSFQIGPQKLPPIVIPYRDAAGKLREAKTPEFSVEIQSYLKQLQTGEKTPLRPVKPPIYWSLSKQMILLIAGLVVLGFMLLGLLAWYIRRRMRRPKIIQTPPPLAPDEEALQALAQLELAGMVDREGAKPYYIRLSEILRRYLGRRYGFDALEMTSGELLERAGNLGLTKEIYQSILDDTVESDSVKFAQYVPSLPKREMALQRIRQIVLDTRPDAPMNQSQNQLPARKIEESNPA